MNLEKSGNPAFGKNLLRDLVADREVMTFQGAINKTILLFVLLVAAAAFTWTRTMDQNTVSAISSYVIAGAIGGFIVSMIIILKPTTSPYLAPLYAILEGFFLGSVSASLEQVMPGIVVQSVMATLGIFTVLLVIYKSGLIRVTQKFRMIVVGAMFGILIYYLVGWILSFFGMNISLANDTGIWGIAFSVVLVVIASLNIVLDFDYMQKSSEENAPKYMEWYFGFALMLTLVWLYLEILRLLAKLKRD